MRKYKMDTLGAGSDNFYRCNTCRTETKTIYYDSNAPETTQFLCEDCYQKLIVEKPEQAHDSDLVVLGNRHGICGVECKPQEAIKDDSAKLPYHLIPFDALEEVVKVLQYGQQKYADRNWEKGLAYHRNFSATLRHLVAWWQRGEQCASDSQLHHLAHAAADILFLLAYEMRNMQDFDDRPKVQS